MKGQCSERYQRPRALLGSALDERLSAFKLGIIGLGGLGGLTAYLLAGAGLLRFKLADPDVVSLSNLHRQVLYDETQLLHKKNLCAKDALQRLDARVDCELFAAIDEENFTAFAQDLDLMVDLTDSVKSRCLISRLSVQHRVDYVMGSVSKTVGNLCYFRHSDPLYTLKHGCLNCLFPADKKVNPAITGAAAAMMAAAVADFIQKLVLADDKERLEMSTYLQVFDLNNFSKKAFTLKRDPNCRCAMCAYQAAAKRSKGEA